MIEKANSEIVFQRTDVEFYDFRTYCCNFVTNGDWVIPLGSKKATERKYEEGGFEEDTKDFMKSFDDGLINIYRRQDDKLVMKNIKMLGDRNEPRKKGVYDNILKFINTADHMISKLPRKSVEVACDYIRNFYDKYMKDPTTGQQIETHIWIPIWRTTCKDALLISLLGRINLIIT